MSYYFRQANEDLRWQRKLLLIAMVILVLFNAWALWGWTQATRELPALHLAPNMTQGTVIRPGEVPDPNVYGFTYYVWQQINRWKNNGQQDYSQAIFRFSPYLTPRFREELIADMRRRALAGELEARARGVQEMPGHHYAFNRVHAEGDGVWVIWLDLTVEEFYRKTLVKSTCIRYPLRTVRMDIDKSLNPFGLALDGFATREGPVAIDCDTDDHLAGAVAP